MVSIIVPIVIIVMDREEEYGAEGFRNATNGDRWRAILKTSILAAHVIIFEPASDMRLVHA